MLSSHDYHQQLPGYNEGQILHDGCGEWERRGESVSRALGYMDSERFEKAWARAHKMNAYRAGGVPLAERSGAEMPVLNALWEVMVHLERRGVPMDGVPPGGVQGMFRRW